MPKLLSWSEKHARKLAAKAAKEAALLPPDELKKRRAQIYGTTPYANKAIAELKTRRTAKTLSEGRKQAASSPRTAKQISVRLALDVEEFAISHTPMAAYINDLIRRDMMAQKDKDNETDTKD